ncbi:MAG: hypothetical protein JSR17_03595 [Proteobacteria bacterium]|nr:hypothetical protein [Pseudomonadota bacterium]
MLGLAPQLPEGLVEISDDFIKAKELFHILTGIEPRYSEETFAQTAGVKSKGAHLRFIFESKDKFYDKTRALLQLMGIQHTETYTCLEPRKGKAITELYICVTQDQFKRLISFFEPGATMSKSLTPAHKIKSTSHSNIDASVMDILFDPHLFEAIESRNRKKHPLEGILKYFAELILKSAPCFSLLAQQGIKYEPYVDLSVDETEKTVSPTITFAYSAAGNTQKSPPLPVSQDAKEKHLHKPQ